MSDDKKFYRDLKRAIKKTGNKKRRRFYKTQLETSDEREFDFGRDQSSTLNGQDRDATRKKNEVKSLTEHRKKK